MSKQREAKVYVNGSLIGTHPDPHKLANDIREARRRGEIDEMVNEIGRASCRERV